jgi:hypothetical protein
VTATDRLYAEMGALAAAFSWSRDDLMSLEHAERRRWIAEARALTNAAGDRNGRPASAPERWL